MATESARDDRPRKKKKKKKSGAGLWIGLGVGGGVLLVILIAIVVVVALRPWERGGEKKDNVAQNPPPQQQPPNNNLGGDVVKKPKTLLGNIRARGAQAERDAEMIGIVRLYHAYCDEVKNPNARNLDGFLRSIRSEPAKIVNGVRSKEYLINYKARVGSDDIVVYESEQYDRGYFCFHANNQSDYVPAQELKAAGLLAPAEQDQKK
jgi:hypothetical protein